MPLRLPGGAVRPHPGARQGHPRALHLHQRGPRPGPAAGDGRSLPRAQYCAVRVLPAGRGGAARRHAAGGGGAAPGAAGAGEARADGRRAAGGGEDGLVRHGDAGGHRSGQGGVGGRLLRAPQARRQPGHAPAPGAALPPAVEPLPPADDLRLHRLRETSLQRQGRGGNGGHVRPRGRARLPAGPPDPGAAAVPRHRPPVHPVVRGGPGEGGGHPGFRDSASRAAGPRRAQGHLHGAADGRRIVGHEGRGGGGQGHRDSAGRAAAPAARPPGRSGTEIQPRAGPQLSVQPLQEVRLRVPEQLPAGQVPQHPLEHGHLWHLWRLLRGPCLRGRGAGRLRGPAACPARDRLAGHHAAAVLGGSEAAAAAHDDTQGAAQGAAAAGGAGGDGCVHGHIDEAPAAPARAIPGAAHPAGQQEPPARAAGARAADLRGAGRARAGGRGHLPQDRGGRGLDGLPPHRAPGRPPRAARRPPLARAHPRARAEARRGGHSRQGGALSQPLRSHGVQYLLRPDRHDRQAHALHLAGPRARRVLQPSGQPGLRDAPGRSGALRDAGVPGVAGLRPARDGGRHRHGRPHAPPVAPRLRAPGGLPGPGRVRHQPGGQCRARRALLHAQARPQRGPARGRVQIPPLLRL
mmetsp:Transcript_15446/g.34070  ORF Transcript_15446/g.34070 Transcript_15446/m.34070 type:complete len:634 (+) Transcript_15446:2355-4256(+)